MVTNVKICRGDKNIAKTLTKDRHKCQDL